MVWITAKRGRTLTHTPVVYTSDSQYFFCCSDDTIRMFNVNTGEEVRTLRGHTNLVTRVLLNPNNPTQIYSASLDGTIRLWNFEDAVTVTTFTIGTPINLVDIDHEHQILYFVTPVQGKPKSNIFSYDLNLKKASPTPYLTLSSVISFLYDPRGFLAIIPDGSFDLIIWDCKSHSYRSIAFERPITTVASHPKTNYLAVGDKHGRIFLSYCIGKDQHASKKLHWHSSSISSLTFTTDGLYLLSGAKEPVLTLWQLNTDKRQHIARLSGSIMGISVAHDSSSYTVVLSDNTIKVINSLSLKDISVVSGLHKAVEPPKDVGIIMDPKNGFVAINNISSTVQFFQPFQDRFVSSIEIAPRYFDGKSQTGPEAIVHFVCFTHDGLHMATVDTRLVGTVYQTSLKFWFNSPIYQQFVLNTRVDNPHDDKITSIVAHPNRHAIVTSSTDKRFKFWIKVALPKNPKTLDRSQQHSWMCRSVGTFDNTPCIVASFSSDGSLLAASFGKRVTLWDPVSNSFIKDFSQPKAIIKHLSFIANSPFLITASSDQIFVWNLLNENLWWNYEVPIFTLTSDPDGKRFLVITKQEEKNLSFILLFDVQSPIPVCCWKVKDNISSAIFLPLSILSSNNSLSSTSILYFTSQQEVFLLEEVKISEDMDQIVGPTAQVPLRTPVQADALFTTVVANNKNKGDDLAGNIFIGHLPSLSTLFDSPSHVLPPMPALYKSFMDIMVIKDQNQPPKLRTEEVDKNNENTPMDMEKKDNHLVEVENEEGMNYHGMLEFFKELKIEAVNALQNSKQNRKKPRNEEQQSNGKVDCNGGEENSIKKAKKADLNGSTTPIQTNELLSDSDEEQSLLKTPKKGAKTPKKGAKTPKKGAKTPKTPNEENKMQTRRKRKTSENELVE